MLLYLYLKQEIKISCRTSTVSLVYSYLAIIRKYSVTDSYVNKYSSRKNFGFCILKVYEKEAWQGIEQELALTYVSWDITLLGHLGVMIKVPEISSNRNTILKRATWFCKNRSDIF